MNLFKGYKACKDSEFVDYIKKKEDHYEEGGNVDYQQLMDWALNKFQSRKESNQWCQKTSEEETIVALQAQVSTLMSSRTKDGAPKGVTKGKKGAAGTKKGSKGKSYEKHAWMTVPPKEGEKQSKHVDDKVYHWCPNHVRWTRHTASECKGIDFRSGESKPKGGKGQPSDSSTKATMKLNKALTAISDNEE